MQATVPSSTPAPRTAYNPKGADLGKGGQQAFKWVNQVAAGRVDCQRRDGGLAAASKQTSSKADEPVYAGMSLSGPVKVIRPGVLPANPEYSIPKDEQ